jgi:hypothetical protein
MGPERRGFLVVANRPMGPAGCSILAVGVVFLIGALYGLYGDRSLKPDSWLAPAFVGGSLFAIFLGSVVIAWQRAGTRTWRGFAVGPDGATRAVIRAADPQVAESVEHEPIRPSGKGKPGVAVVLVHSAGQVDLIYLAYIGYHDGQRPQVGVPGATARLGTLPRGKMSQLRPTMTGANDLRPLAEALRDHAPGLPVTLVVAAPRADRSMKSAFFFGLIGAAVEEAFASAKDRKSRAAFEQALGGDLGRELGAFSEEFGWALETS